MLKNLVSFKNFNQGGSMRKDLVSSNEVWDIVNAQEKIGFSKDTAATKKTVAENNSFNEYNHFDDKLVLFKEIGLVNQPNISILEKLKINGFCKQLTELDMDNMLGITEFNEQVNKKISDVSKKEAKMIDYYWLKMFVLFVSLFVGIGLCFLSSPCAVSQSSKCVPCGRK